MIADALFIFGAQSTAVEIAELAEVACPDFQLFHVVGDGQPADGEGIIRVSELPAVLSSVNGRRCGIISMSNVELREQRAELMESLGIEAISLIHFDATVAPSAQIGSGCYIAAGARISSNAVIGPHCMINLNATVGHDAVTGSHCVINPGAAIGGNAQLGNRVLIGANAFVLQSVKVTDGCRVDALTYVSRNILPNHTVSCRRPLIVLPQAEFADGEDN